jgi:tRNA G26 N,N-dimethylase Trm1
LTSQRKSNMRDLLDKLSAIAEAEESVAEETLSESGKDCSCCGNKINAEGKCGCDESCEHCGGQHDLSEAAKPDYIDLDGDGDEEESMKKAAKDKEKQDESVEPRLGESWLQNYQAILVQR